MKQRAALSFVVLTAASLALSDSPKPGLPKVPPLKYFDDRCARCHGPQGSFYGNDFGKGLSEEALKKVVYDMCRNQGEMKLEGFDLEAQVAYHRSMIAKELFLVVTKIENGVLSGEVTEKATVEAKFKSSTVRAEVKGATWTARIPNGEKAATAVVSATLDKQSATLKVAQQYFTHAKPLAKSQSP
jgi:hypothetical protein